MHIQEGFPALKKSIYYNPVVFDVLLYLPLIYFNTIFKNSRSDNMNAVKNQWYFLPIVFGSVSFLEINDADVPGGYVSRAPANCAKPWIWYVLKNI